MEQALQYAGFWRRAAASLLDGLIFVIPAVLLQIVLVFVISTLLGYDTSYKEFANNTAPDSVAIATNLGSAAIWVVVIYKFLTGAWQATPGKRIMNVFVADEQGNKITKKHALIRILSPYGLFILPFFVVLLFNPNNKMTEKNEAHYQFIADLQQVMPLTTQKLIDSDLPALTFIAKIETDEEIKEIYVKEYSSLSEDDRESANEIGKNFIEQQKPTTTTSILFLVFYIIWLITSFVWYLMAAFTKQKTALHDIFAKTRVLIGKA